MEATTIVVTNYQQYINAEFLMEGISNSLPDINLPERLYVSIAYVDITKVPAKPGLYKTVVVLSIKGVTHRYEVIHGNSAYYAASVRLQTPEQLEQEVKDAMAKMLNEAFQSVVYARIGKIVKDLIANI